MNTCGIVNYATDHLCTLDAGHAGDHEDHTNEANGEIVAWTPGTVVVFGGRTAEVVDRHEVGGVDILRVQFHEMGFIMLARSTECRPCVGFSALALSLRQAFNAVIDAGDWTGTTRDDALGTRSFRHAEFGGAFAGVIHSATVSGDTYLLAVGA